jgi:hypothetical protein
MVPRHTIGTLRSELPRFFRLGGPTMADDALE